MAYGPHILTRTLTAVRRRDKYGNEWQYLSRGDHHSKVACWGVIFDLLRTSPLLRRHVESGLVGFGINHEMRDFVQDRKKDLDLVLCTRRGHVARRLPKTLKSMITEYEIILTPQERAEFDSLPTLEESDVGAVLMALEAKACMTAHQRALPRLYDELNSSHATVHGATNQAIAAGFTMVNVAEKYYSPDLNKKNRLLDPEVSTHDQPRDAELAIAKIRQLPRRASIDAIGYDALAIVVIDCANDGTEVRLVDGSPAPSTKDIYNYDSMIERLAHLYATRFKEIG